MSDLKKLVRELIDEVRLLRAENAELRMEVRHELDNSLKVEIKHLKIRLDSSQLELSRLCDKFLKV